MNAPERITEEEAVRRALALGPAIRARAQQVEDDRRIADETVAELRQAGLLGLAVPARFGGSELGLAPLFSVGAALAEACGSTGWVASVFTGHNWLVALFPEEAQAEVFADPQPRVASVVHFAGNPPSSAPGGYRFRDGLGKLCSGVDHAEWVLLGTGVVDGNAPPEPRYFLVPKDAFEIVDDWFTAGLRGTGSKSIRLADAFVPEHRTISITDLARGAAPGLAANPSIIYRAPFPEVFILGLTGAPIGMARGAIGLFADGLRARYADMPDQQIAEQSTPFARLADASARVDAAEGLVRETARRIDATEDPATLTRLERARFLRNYAFAVQTCRQAVGALFEGGGSGAVYDGSALQRMWRDINTAAMHAGFNWDGTVPTFARALLDLPPGQFERRRGH